MNMIDIHKLIFYPALLLFITQKFFLFVDESN